MSQERVILISSQYKDGSTSGLSGLRSELEDTLRALEAVRDAGDTAQGAFDQIGSGASDAASGLGVIDDAAFSAADGLYGLTDSSGEATLALGEIGVASGDAASGMGDVSGEASGMAGSLDYAASSAREAGQETQQLSADNQDLESAFGAATRGGDGLLNMLADVGPKAAAAAAALKTVIDTNNEWSQAFAGDESSQARFNNIFRQNIAGYEQYIGVVNRAISASMQMGFTDDETRDSLGKMFGATHNVAESLSRLTVEQNLARYGNASLQEATSALTTALETGTTRGLRSFGIYIDKGASSAQILDQVMRQTAGSVEAYNDTIEASNERAANSFSELQEAGGAATADATRLHNEGKAVLYEELEAYGALGAGLGTFAEKLDGISFLFPTYNTALEMAAKSERELADETANTASSMDDSASNIVDSGLTVTDFWGNEVPATFENTWGTISDTMEGMTDSIDVGELWSQLGANAGGGWGSAVNAEMAAWIPAIQGQADNAIGQINRVIGAISDMRTMLGQVALAGLDIKHAADDAREDNRQNSVKGTPYYAGTQKQAAKRRLVGAAQDQKDYLDEEKAWTNHLQAMANASQKADVAAAKRSTGSSGGRGGKTATPKKITKKATGKSDAEKLDDANEDLAKAKAQFDQDTKQLGLERALADAQDDVTAAQKRATDMADGYASVQKFVKDSIDRNKEAMTQATAQMQTDLANQQQALADLRDKDEEDLHGLAVAIHDVNETLKNLEKSAKAALDPLADGAEKARKAVSDLQKETARTNDQMERAKRDDQDALYALGEREKGLRSLDAAMRDGQKELKRRQENVDAVAESYDKKLLPLQKEYNALKDEEANIDRGKTVKDMAVSVANLSAQMKNATPGSRNWNALLREREAAQAKLNRTQKEYSLEDQMKALEAAKTAAVDSANVQVKAQQEVLDKMAEARDEQQYQIDQERQIVQDRLDLADREQEMYNRTQHDKEVAAQEEADRAQEAYDTEKDKQDKLAEPYQQELDRLQTAQEKKQWEASEAERAAQRNIDAKVKQIKDTEAPYNTETERLNNIAKLVGDNALLDEAAAKTVIDNAKDVATAASDALDAFKDKDKEADIAQRWSDAQKKWSEAVGSLADSAPKVADLDTNAKNAAKSTDDAGKAVIAAAAALNTNLAPAIGNMVTNAQPDMVAFWQLWLQYFGTPNQETTGLIAELLSTHNTKGFWAYLESNARLGLGGDGYRGVWIQELQILFEAIATKFNDEKPSLDLATKNTGIHTLDGVTVGMNDSGAWDRMAAALIAALDNALDKGEKHLEINSPSKKSGRRLGLPFMEGIPWAFAEAAPAAARDMNRTLNSLVGSLEMPSMSVSARGRVSVPVGAGAGFIDQSTNSYSFPLPAGTDVRDYTEEDWARVAEKARQGERLFKNRTGRN